MNDDGIQDPAGPTRAPLWPKGNVNPALAVVLVGATIARILWVLSADLRSLTFRTTDDSYYYFQVARNVTHGLGWTFDGMHPTNGFHPLWMAMLLPIYALAGHDPVLSLRAVQVLESLLAAVTVVVAWLGVRRLAGERAALVAGLLAVQPFAQYPLVNGLETGVLVLSFFLLLWAGAKWDLLAPRAGLPRDAALGALLGLAFLARLDSVFLVPAFSFVVFRRAFQETEGKGWFVPALAKLVRTGVVFTAVCAPYLLWNHATFHHFVPISGAIKSTFPHVSFTPSRIAGFNSLYGLALFGASTAMLCSLALMRAFGAADEGRRRPQGWTLCWAFWGGNLLHLAYSLAFVDWGAQWWHYVAYLPVTLASAALLFGEIDRRAGFRRSTLVLAVLGAVILFVAGIAGDSLQRGKGRSVWFDAMTWERDSLPRGAVLAMTDCGFIGYFGGHPVVNLDGVINSYGFQDTLQQNRLADFLAASGVTHIGSHLARYENGRAIVYVRSRLVRGPYAEILCPPEAEVFRSREFLELALHPELGMVRFVIWDLRRVRIVEHG